MKKQIIIGIIGEIASGKDTVANFIRKKYKAKVIPMSGSLREGLNIFDLPQTRHNMWTLSEGLRKMFSPDIVAKGALKKIENAKEKIICVTGIRFQADLKHFEHLPSFVLVFVKVDAKIRFKRLKKRGQNADDNTKTWTQFQKDCKLSTEVHIKKLTKKADFVLDNNGTVDDLRKQIKKLIKNIKAHVQK